VPTATATAVQPASNPARGAGIFPDFNPTKAIYQAIGGLLYGMDSMFSDEMSQIWNPLVAGGDNLDGSENAGVLVDNTKLKQMWEISLGIAGGSLLVLLFTVMVLLWMVGEFVGAGHELGRLLVNFVVFFVCVILTAISLGVYNSYASPYLGALGIKNVAGVLAIGQISEVICIVTIPFVLARIGMKWALLLGMFMWGIRFTLFIVAGWMMEALAKTNDTAAMSGGSRMASTAKLPMPGQAKTISTMTVPPMR